MPNPVDLLRQLGMTPDGQQLLDKTCHRLSSSMLEKIARADYGSDVLQHRRALEAIVVSGKVPDPLGWHPGEVLELIRWSEPETPGWSPGGSGQDGHVTRAFSCTVLLLSAGQSAGRLQLHAESEPDTLVQLISSVVRLGPEFSLPTANLILSRLEGKHPAGDSDRPFFVLGLLLVLRAGGLATPSRDQWSVLANWLDDAEVEARLASSWPDSGYWLLDIAPRALRRDSWRLVAREAFGAGGPAGAELIARRVAEWPDAG